MIFKPNQMKPNQNKTKRKPTKNSKREITSIIGEKAYDVVGN